MPINLKKKTYGVLKNVKYWVIVSLKSRFFRNENLYEVNLLVVKDLKYIDLAYDCIQSFLAFHPNSKFEIHVDEVTSASTINRFTRRNLADKCTFINIVDSRKKWQEMKLDIILSQSGTHKLFLDADLRWYGPLPTIKAVTFLVDEGPLSKSDIFLKILKSNPEFNSESHMINVSFVALNGVTILPEMQQKIRETRKNYDAIISQAVHDSKDIEIVARLREQFAISVYAHAISPHYSVLKERDSRAERHTLVSSCYFGSTGLNF
jgi:hypothetical protein